MDADETRRGACRFGIKVIFIINLSDFFSFDRDARAMARFQRGLQGGRAGSLLARRLGLCLALALLADRPLAQTGVAACQNLSPGGQRVPPLPHFRRVSMTGGDVRVALIGPAPLRLEATATSEDAFAMRMQAALRAGLLHSRIFVSPQRALDGGIAAGLDNLRNMLAVGPPDFAVWRVGPEGVQAAGAPARAETLARQGLGLLRAAGVEAALVAPPIVEDSRLRGARDAIAVALGKAVRDFGGLFIDPVATPALATLERARLEGTDAMAPPDCLPEWIAGQIVSGVRAATPGQ